MPAGDAGRRRASEAGRSALARLARARGVEPHYLGADGKPKRSSEDALVGVLAALGEPVVRPDDAAAALAARRAATRHGRRGGPRLPPVIVAWDGRAPGTTAHPAARLVLEGGDEVAPAGPLPFGYHELFLGDQRLAHVISAPCRPDGTGEAPAPRGFALFAPTYAIVDARRRCAGDLESLRRLGLLAARFGASAVATLPLLAEPATADGGAAGQQPYAPLSRVHWNEALLDLARLPELDPADRARLERGELAPPLRRGAGGRPLADLAGLATVTRPVLDRAAARIEGRRTARQRAYAAFVRGNDELGAYCRFRAALEQRGLDRRLWPASWRDGRIAEDEVPAAAPRRHAYAQFAMDRQLAEDAAALAAAGCGLLLDLPVGCRPDGYDPWAQRGAFASGASIGAPPDPFFPGGQDWRFPPPHPDGDRVLGYRHLREVIAFHLRHANWLRIDHVLGWWRLWWVPDGLPPTEGAYVRYPTDELLAVACLEAWRAGARLVGEDLGTVPRGLRPLLSRHGVSGMEVAVFDLEASPGRRLSPRRGSVAYVDTHDTATFSGMLCGADLSLRRELGILPAATERGERARRAKIVEVLLHRLVRAGRLEPGRQQDPLAVLAAVLEELGSSPAELVVVSIEDLLGEEVPQNVPGTSGEQRNFCRRLATGLEKLAGEPALARVLERLAAARCATASAACPGGRRGMGRPA